ncbi:MAG: ATP-binding protein [Oscillospiraceae bacterium]|nr:ATP-binding protein [Oscillospiraceae bacterium]
MQEIGEIIRSGLDHPSLRRAQTSPGASTPTQIEGEESIATMRASEAEAAGFTTSDRPAPPPATCQFCGRTLEYMGMVSPICPGRIFLWYPQPERCTCPEAVAMWAQRDKEEAEREAAEERMKQEAAFQARIGKLIRRSGMKGRFQTRTFARWEMTEQNRRAYDTCKRYADRFDMMQPKTDAYDRIIPPKKERNGLILIGGYGTGKTHLAAAIANQLLQSGTAVICVTMIDLLGRIRETYSRDDATEGQVMRLYADIPLLIIDDLGSEQPTEWGSTMIFSIINARYESYMPTIVTTNCGVDELVQRMTPRDATDRNAQKTVDRLREMCVAVPMDWPSWRSK